MVAIQMYKLTTDAVNFVLPTPKLYTLKKKGHQNYAAFNYNILNFIQPNYENFYNCNVYSLSYEANIQV